MTPNPQALSASTTGREGAEAMRANDIGNVVVTDDNGNLAGILTDRDLVVRVIAEGRDPRATRIGDLALDRDPDSVLADNSAAPPNS